MTTSVAGTSRSWNVATKERPGRVTVSWVLPPLGIGGAFPSQDWNVISLGITINPFSFATLVEIKEIADPVSTSALNGLSFRDNARVGGSDGAW